MPSDFLEPARSRLPRLRIFIGKQCLEAAVLGYRIIVDRANVRILRTFAMCVGFRLLTGRYGAAEFHLAVFDGLAWLTDIYFGGTRHDTNPLKSCIFCGT